MTEKVRRPLGTVDFFVRAWGLEEKFMKGVRTYLEPERIDHFLKLFKEWTLIENGRPLGRAGLCAPDSREIELHTLILAPGREEDRNNILLHEIAHMMDWFRQKGHGHGYDWCSAMRAFGLPPSRIHSIGCLIENKREGKTVSYRCERCGYVLSRTRRLPANVNYHHKSCGGALCLVNG